MSTLTDVLTWLGATVAIMLAFVGGAAVCIWISERWAARRDARGLVRELERELERELRRTGKPSPPRAPNPLRPDYPYRDDRRNDE